MVRVRLTVKPCPVVEGAADTHTAVCDTVMASTGLALSAIPEENTAQDAWIPASGIVMLDRIGRECVLARHLPAWATPGFYSLLLSIDNNSRPLSGVAVLSEDCFAIPVAGYPV